MTDDLYQIIIEALDRQIKTLIRQKGYYCSSNRHIAMRGNKNEYDELIIKHKEAKEFVKKVFESKD